MEKKLIIGLGNPGPEYALSRHNAGFLVLDRWAAREGLKWSLERYGWTTQVSIKGRAVTLLKPSTFMNLSGQAVRYYQQALKISLENLLVITDELQIPLGRINLRPLGSAGGHNGLTNIEQMLATKSYPRLRFGIGNNFPKGRQVDYVLGNFTESEFALASLVIDEAIKACESFVLEGLPQAMNKFNNTNFVN